MTGFFLPWSKEKKGIVKQGERKLYLPKESLSLEDACFDNRKPPYVSLPNPRGTLRSFLQAVEKGKKEEAMGYFSCKVASAVDYEEIEGLLKDIKEYHCFAEENRDGIRTVSLAQKGREEEILSFRMIAEPDSYGKWKIFCIEKER